MTGTTARNITEADKRAAANLKRIIDQSPVQLTQTQIAEKLNLKSQSQVSGYLNAKIKLGTDAVLKFAKLYNVSPCDIREDLAEVVAGDLSSVDDYNYVIEAFENALQERGVSVPITKKIQLYKLAYDFYKESKNRDGIKNVIETIINGLV